MAKSGSGAAAKIAGVEVVEERVCAREVCVCVRGVENRGGRGGGRGSGGEHRERAIILIIIIRNNNAII